MGLLDFIQGNRKHNTLQTNIYTGSSVPNGVHGTKHENSIAIKYLMYHLQSNGHAKSTKKIIINTIKKVVGENRKDCDKNLDSAPWAFQTSNKVTTSITPFRLTYGL